MTRVKNLPVASRVFSALAVLSTLALGVLATFDAPVAAAQTIPARVELDSNGIRRAPGQILVKFKPGLKLEGVESVEQAPAQLQLLFSRLGVQRLRNLGGSTNLLLLYFNGSVDRAIEIASTDPAVEQAGANEQMQLDRLDTVVTNDPLAVGDKQWWLDKIQAREAWTLTTGSKSVKVGIVDDGVDANHPDLTGKVIAAYNFAEETGTSRAGNVGHGTAVAGCITANTNNGIGLSGLNWDVSLIDGKAFPQEEGGAFSFDLVRGVIYAIDQGAQVVNNSWGGGALNLATLAMAEYAASRNVTLVFSTGNSGFNQPRLPAALSLGYPNIIAVGATDINDRVTGFSTFGAQTNLVAPGSGIWTIQAGGGYRVINGTSFSAPIVSGVIALMLSVNPGLRPIDIRNILEGTADDISGQGFTGKTGYGRVNAYRAVLAAKNNDLRPNKQSRVSGRISGIDPARVRLSLDPIGLTIRPDSQGNFQVNGLGKATYRLRAAVTGQGTAQGPAEFSLTGATGSTRQVNFAFQNLRPSALAPDNFVDQARFFDSRERSLSGPLSRYFAETGHHLSGIFRQHWESQGGLAVFGYPISEEFVELSETDGKLYTVQYFERNRFEYHPENAGTPYEIQLGLLGSEQTRERNFDRSARPELGWWFEQTGQNLSGRFLEYWQAKGGLALFGYPISGVIEENGRQVQYFERNRLEYHPENAGTPYEVLLGLLGSGLARQRGYL